MVFPCGIQDPFDLVHLTLCPRFIHWSTIMEYSPEYAECREHNNGFFVDNVELIANGDHGE